MSDNRYMFTINYYDIKEISGIRKQEIRTLKNKNIIEFTAQPILPIMGVSLWPYTIIFKINIMAHEPQLTVEPMKRLRSRDRRGDPLPL